MIQKGRQPLYENHKSNMRRVLSQLEQGQNDRGLIAEALGITKRQVRYAIWNLVAAGLIEPLKHNYKNGHGREDTIYRLKGKHVEQHSIYAKCSFIFHFANKDGTASET